MKTNVAIAIVLLGCSQRDRPEAEAPGWQEVVESTLVRYEVVELCRSVDDGDEICAAESASAYLVVADGAVELHASDRSPLAYEGRFREAKTHEELFDVYASWPLGEGGTLVAADAALRVPILGSCEALEQRALLGTCEVATNTAACTLTSVPAETPEVSVAQIGDELHVRFEGAVGRPASRCCEPAAGCAFERPGTFSPAAGVVRGELIARRAP
jgi:hypothetical protein